MWPGNSSGTAVKFLKFLIHMYQCQTHSMKRVIDTNFIMLITYFEVELGTQ